MATVSQWNPFGVALNITATAGTVTRTSATQYTVVINASWKTYWSGNKTNYGMSAASGGTTQPITAFDGRKWSSGSTSFTGTYSISGNSSATKTVTVTFRNFNTDNGDSATKNVSFSVSVPAWISYKVSYNANGGSGAPSAQTKWKDQTLTLSSTKPTRTGHAFKNWNIASGGTGTSYSAGGTIPANINNNVTLYAQWTANTYRIVYDANGGTLGSVTAQTKTYGVNLTLTGTATRINYNFLGWSTSKTATSATYTTGATYSANAAVTLYAVWELAYTKPRITNFSFVRCDENNTPSEEGTCALLKFHWETDYPSPSAEIEILKPPSTSWQPWSFMQLGMLITSDDFEGKLTDVPTDVTCSVRVTVTDQKGSSVKTATIPGIAFPFDALAGNPSGVAFGGPASLPNVADFYYTIHGRNDIKFTVNDKRIYGTDGNGVLTEALNPQNEDGNTIVGRGNYDNKSGSTYVDGHDVHIGVSNIASPQHYRPYRRQGDTMTFNTVRTAGYVTNSGKDVTFWVPLAVPIIGTPTITATSVNGFVLRQGNKYTHGSAASTYVVPGGNPAYSVYRTQFAGVWVVAHFTDTTNVTNNETIGIQWSGTLTFT